MDGIHFDVTAKELITKASGAVKLQSVAFSGAGGRSDIERTSQANEIVHGKRSITVDTALRLGRFFSMSPQFWLNLQTRYDLEVTEVYLDDRRSIEDMISVPFFACFWLQLSVFRCQFARNSFLKPDTRHLKPHLFLNVTK